MKTQKLTMRLSVLCACLTLVSAQATTVTLSVYGPTGNASDVTGDGNGTTAGDSVLGAINPGAPASDAWDAAYVSGILSLGLGGGPLTVGADQVWRSKNNFGTISPDAATITGGDGTSTSITLLAGVAFLVAKYDGPNGGSEVWYVGNLAAGTTIVIPQNAFGNNNGQYGLSGTVQLAGSNTPPPPVPDGASTAMLLGIASLGVGMLKRRFAKQ